MAMEITNNYNAYENIYATQKQQRNRLHQERKPQKRRLHRKIPKQEMTRRKVRQAMRRN